MPARHAVEQLGQRDEPLARLGLRVVEEIAVIRGSPQHARRRGPARRAGSLCGRTRGGRRTGFGARVASPRRGVHGHILTSYRAAGTTTRDDITATANQHRVPLSGLEILAAKPRRPSNEPPLTPAPTDPIDQPGARGGPVPPLATAMIKGPYARGSLDRRVSATGSVRSAAVTIKPWSSRPDTGDSAAVRFEDAGPFPRERASQSEGQAHEPGQAGHLDTDAVSW